MPAKRFKTEAVPSFPEDPKLRAKVAWLKIYRERGMKEKAEQREKMLRRMGIDVDRLKFYAPPKKKKKAPEKRITLPSADFYRTLLREVELVRKGKAPVPIILAELERIQTAAKRRLMFSKPDSHDRAVAKAQLDAVNRVLEDLRRETVMKAIEETGLPTAGGGRIISSMDLTAQMARKNVPDWYIDELKSRGELREIREGWLVTGPAAETEQQTLPKEGKAKVAGEKAPEDEYSKLSPVEKLLPYRPIEKGDVIVNLTPDMLEKMKDTPSAKYVRKGTVMGEKLLSGVPYFEVYLPHEKKRDLWLQKNVTRVESR